MKIILIGGPGAGKGTRAKFISEKFGIPHISTGNLCRQHVAKKGEHTEYIEKCFREGNLVSDEVTLALLKEKLSGEDCKAGFILDGFPRNIDQAKELGKVDHILHFDCEEEVLIKRLMGRLTCKGCGKVYNLTGVLPKEENKCDGCSAELSVRNDDKEEITKERMKVYKEQTEPLLEFYKDEIKRFDVSKEIDESVSEIISFLEKGPVV